MHVAIHEPVSVWITGDCPCFKASIMFLGLSFFGDGSEASLEAGKACCPLLHVCIQGT